MTTVSQFAGSLSANQCRQLLADHDAAVAAGDQGLIAGAITTELLVASIYLGQVVELLEADIAATSPTSTTTPINW